MEEKVLTWINICLRSKKRYKHTVSPQAGVMLRFMPFNTATTSLEVGVNK